MKREFLESLMEDYNGLPEGWSIKRDSVKTETVRTECFEFKIGSSKLSHEIAINAGLAELTVEHSADSFDGETTRSFSDPEKAAIYTLAVAEALSEQERAEESSSDGLGELFG